MEPTIVLKNISKPKFTITPTRFEIKMPAHYDAVWSGQITAFAKTVAARLGTPTQSLRGTVESFSHRLQVRLRKDNKEAVGVFVEGEDGHH